MRKKIIALALACASLPLTPPARAAAPAKGAEYNAVVKLVESHYRVKHIGVPLLADLGMKTAKVVSSRVRRAMRYGSFKLAIFEDQDFSAGREDNGAEFHALLRRTLEPDWTRLLAARGEDAGPVYTYVKAAGSKFKVLIVVVAQRDGVMLQLKLDVEESGKVIRSHEEESRGLATEAASEANNQ